MRVNRGAWVSVAVLAAIVESCAHASSTARSSAVACEFTWTAPQPLEHDGGKPVAIAGDVVESLSGHRVMLSNVTIFWAEEQQMVDSARAANDSAYAKAIAPNFTSIGGEIDDPRATRGLASEVSRAETASRFLRQRYTMVGRTASGIRVAWLASDASPKGTTDAGVSDYEFASFDGQHWGVRTRVPIGAPIDWFDPPVRRAGRPFELRAMAFRVSPKNQIPHVEVWTIRDDHLQRVSTIRDLSGFAPSLAQLRDGTLVLSMLADVDKVHGWFSRRGRLVGDSVRWDAPVLIDPVGRSTSPYEWAQLGGDSLMLAWYREKTDSTSSQLRVVVSPDGGRTWTAEAPPPLQSSVAGTLQLAVDVTGTPHLMLDVRTDSGVPDSLAPKVVSSWRHGQWTVPQTIAVPGLELGSSLRALSDGSLIASWMKVRTFTARGISPVSYVAIGRPVCIR